MNKLPDEFLEHMKEQLKDEYIDFINSYNQETISSLRINTNKISIKDFLNINPFNLTKVVWSDDGFYYSKEDEPTKHPYYYAGLYYIQEASAMLPAQVLPVKENDIVFDACAAPGGKSLKILNKLNNTGLNIANDISVSRAQVLLKNIENQGFKNYIVMAQDINDLNNFNEYFDCILLDAPCSGEGMFRKDPSLINNWLDKNPNYYSNIQKQLITKALKMLKKGGHLVYSTCTFSIKENEEVIEYALDNNPDITLLPIKKYPGFKDGLTDKTKHCVRLYPHLVKGEGHFVSLIQKQGEYKTNITNNHIDHIDIELLKDIDFYNGKFINRKEKIYYEPDLIPNIDGLRVLRSGLLLGEYKHDKFEPSQALASSLKINEYKNIINFGIEDDRVIKYLKCETLDVKDKYVEGYVLVCVDNYPLGFGLVNKGILKNKYPANYRYR